LAIAIPHELWRALPADGPEFPDMGQQLFGLLLQLAGMAVDAPERRHAAW
jgi:hypothetical protein